MLCIMRERILFLTMGVSSTIVTLLTVRSIVESQYEQLWKEMRDRDDTMKEYIRDNNKKVRDEIITGRLKERSFWN